MVDSGDVRVWAPWLTNPQDLSLVPKDEGFLRMKTSEKWGGSEVWGGKIDGTPMRDISQGSSSTIRPEFPQIRVSPFLLFCHSRQGSFWKILMAGLYAHRIWYNYLGQFWCIARNYKQGNQISENSIPRSSFLSSLGLHAGKYLSSVRRRFVIHGLCDFFIFLPCAMGQLLHYSCLSSSFVQF